MGRLFLLYLYLVGVFAYADPKTQTPALAISAQTDPVKLASLKGERAANPSPGTLFALPHSSWRVGGGFR